MKLQKKNQKWIIVLSTVLFCMLLAAIIMLHLNTYSLEWSISEGQCFYLEYGMEQELPEVTACYKGSVFNRKGTQVKAAANGDVNLNQVGTYEVVYTAEYKKQTAAVKVTVIVEDNTPPVISLVTHPDRYTRPTEQYVEEGFSAYDNYDGDIAERVVREEQNGVVTYTVSDSSGNETVEKRTIVYKDVTAPAITLLGEQEMTISIGTEYTEPGFSANDDCDGDLTQEVVVEGQVNGHECGRYFLTYFVKDSYGNTCKIQRIVNVADITAPEISLQGEQQLYLKVGETYSEQGYCAIDNADGDITEKVNVSGSVDTGKPGSYTITYQVKDEAGNAALQTRNIYVYEKQMQNSVVNPGDKVVYLTFDDGPGKYTQQLLDILDQYGVKVTFFVTNQNPEYQNMIGEAYRRGHTIGLHSYSHDYNIYESEEIYYHDLNLISEICIAQTGVQPTIVRFPGGGSNTISRKYSKGIMSALAESLAYHGYLYCDWNVISGDAGQVTTADEVADNVINGIKSNQVSIVLQHDIKEYSVEAVEEIVAWGLANGYTFLPMTEDSPMIHHKVNN